VAIPQPNLAETTALACFAACRHTAIPLGKWQSLWTEQTQAYLGQLHLDIAQKHFPRVVLALSDPVEGLAGFMAACIANCPVFLGNPHWSSQEWQQVIDQVQPHYVWGKLPADVSIPAPSPPQSEEKGWIMIPTGGSSGCIKFVIHTWATLAVAVQGFQVFFAVPTVNTCCVLPLYHVSGLMQFMRSLLTQGQCRILPFAELLSGESEQPANAPFLDNDSLEPQTFFLSLVPTQLQRLLQQPQRLPWLQRFPTILLGGAPAWPDLLSQAREYRLNLAPTYGMTETAAQVATLTPQAFLQGHPSTGRSLPHVELSVLDATGQVLPPDHVGQVTSRSAALCLGYYPTLRTTSDLRTDDQGYLDHQGYLYLSGRSSRKIISGGENIFPEAVEAALYGTGLVQDVYVLGLPDPEWGEVVVALYVPSGPHTTLEQLRTGLQNRLSRYQHPKHWIPVEALPRNPQQKVDDAQARLMGWTALKGQNLPLMNAAAIAPESERQEPPSPPHRG
jgi:o-succinylbenzoate---CoA ligase